MSSSPSENNFTKFMFVHRYMFRTCSDLQQSEKRRENIALKTVSRNHMSNIS